MRLAKGPSCQGLHRKCCRFSQSSSQSLGPPKIPDHLLDVAVSAVQGVVQAAHLVFSEFAAQLGKLLESRETS